MGTKVALYNEKQDAIQSLFRSRLKTQVMIALHCGMKPLSELREITGSTSQALLPKIRSLEGEEYVERIRGDYALTPVGRVLAGKICEVVDTIAAVGNNRAFWSSHYMEAIPAAFLDGIGCLHSARLVTNNEGDVFAVFRNYESIIRSAECILGVTSIMSTYHADAIAARVREGVRAELIVNPQLAQTLEKEPYLEKLAALADYPDFRIHVVNEPLVMGMTATDRWLSLGLYRQDRQNYDHTCDLVSEAPEAVAWGWRLFEHYLADAVEADFFR